MSRVRAIWQRAGRGRTEGGQRAGHAPRRGQARTPQHQDWHSGRWQGGESAAQDTSGSDLTASKPYGTSHPRRTISLKTYAGNGSSPIFDLTAASAAFISSCTPYPQPFLPGLRKHQLNRVLIRRTRTRQAPRAGMSTQVQTQVGLETSVLPTI